MEVLNGTILFWFIAQGMALGMIFGMIIKAEGVTVPANMIWGIIGSVVTGSIAVIFGLGDGVIFALVGTMAFLFIVNAFHLHHEEDVLGHVDHGIKISEQ